MQKEGIREPPLQNCRRSSKWSSRRTTTMSAPAPSMYSPAAQRIAEKLGLKMGRPNLEVFADTVLVLAKADRNILAVTSDSRGSGKLGPFGQALPKQIVEVGIAEQNLVGIAAGLGSCGKKVFAVSPACFVTARSLEQLKNDICYSDHPVVVVGISAGVSYGALGTTHHSLHDFAVLRAINNITVVAPADNTEAREAVRAAARHDKPVYLRFGKAPLYTLPNSQIPFAFGRAREIRAGNDVAFLATGETVIHALLAAAHLEETARLKCRVVSLPSVKPLDYEAVLAAARDCRAVITVEEHMMHGGLGEAVASLLAQNEIARPFRIVGIPDEYTVTGSQADIFRHYGLTMEGLAETACALLGNVGQVSDLPLGGSKTRPTH
jgi:transketolase